MFHSRSASVVVFAVSFQYFPQRRYLGLGAFGLCGKRVYRIFQLFRRVSW